MPAKQKKHELITWDTVKPKAITWLWQDRIPFGKISIMVGDSGLGKTTVALDIAARLTTGRPMPLSDAEPITGAVIFQSNEDEVDDTLLPRGISAGAVPSKIASIKAADLNIDEDCGIIEEYVQKIGARLIVFDPLQSFTGKSADMNRITDMRRLLTNLGGLAARNDCAILIIAHQTKSQGTNELHRLFGSVDIGATARSVLRVSASDSDKNIRIISHIKSSMSRPAAPLAFRIDDSSSIEYLGEYDGDIESLEIPDDDNKETKATEIMYTMLANGAVKGAEIYEACKAAGIGSRTVETAKKNAGVISLKDGTGMWKLP